MSGHRKWSELRAETEAKWAAMDRAPDPHLARYSDGELLVWALYDSASTRRQVFRELIARHGKGTEVEDLCRAGLAAETPSEREEAIGRLMALVRARDLGLTEGVHPDYDDPR